MTNLTFAHPHWFVLLIIPIVMIVWYVFKKNTYPSIVFSTASVLHQHKKSWKIFAHHVLFAMQILSIILIIVALARPQTSNTWKDVETEGIDIVISLDVSGSMLARDFKPDRLEASKDIAAEFINNRPNDRIGLVIFSATSFTQCPLTTDHTALINLFKSIKYGLLDDGTAIGDGLATAVARIKDSDAKSKVIILLTDGVNNAGSIDPYTAAEIAKTFGIRVYTIGVGSLGQAPYPVQTPFGTQLQMMKVEIDEPLLRKIADITGGKYFRATDNDKLRQIYNEIDQMEKTKLLVHEYHKRKEEFPLLLIIAAALLLFKTLCNYTLFKKLP
ncbi:MAG: VWA domain-containing protein [Bacteroidales bacterium]|nr:VWA domain-containing protein [Bacteroidales bacterium]